MRTIQLLALACSVGAAAGPALEITVYNSDLALVKDRRGIDPPKGVSSLPWEGVAQTMDPSSASFSCPIARLLEQNYRYDLVSRDALLQKYLGRDVTLVRETQAQDGRTVSTETTGRILSLEGDRIGSLESGGKILLDPPGRVVLPSLPEGLLVRPTLVLDLQSPEGGHSSAELRYLCHGLSWKADYVAVLDSSDSRMDLDGLVTLVNRCGTSFHDATLKLVAGDVNLVPDVPRPQSMPKAFLARSAGVAMDEAAPPFSEQGLLEYHLYSLDRPTTLLDNEQKQISLLSARGAVVRKRFVFDESLGSRYWWWNRDADTKDGRKLAVIVDVANSEANRLGMPLPKGKVRVYKADATGQLQFVGEDLIDHTPRGDTLHLSLGQAFELRGKRVVESSRTTGPEKTETVSVTLTNAKDEPAVAEVVEHQNWPDWKVEESSQKYLKKDASTIVFQATIPARGETTVRYTYWAGWK